MNLPSPHVLVLLSTYNGEHYLVELLDSLYAQTTQNFSLWVRDDGSSDRTLEILRQYRTCHDNITLIEGSNIGVIGSFMTLVRECSVEPGQLYAFCDQDDIWFPEKLARATVNITAAKNPSAALYCSRLIYTDNALHPIGTSAIPRFFGFENALVENVAIGCTMVFGEIIRQKMLAANPERMMMHDWWAYLVAGAFGEVIYDSEPGIYYRQHATNTVGWNKRLTGMLRKSRGFLANILKDRQGLQSLRQAACFLETYPELASEKQATIREILSLREHSGLWVRYRFLRQTKIQRNHALENFILNLTILLNLH